MKTNHKLALASGTMWKMQLATGNSLGDSSTLQLHGLSYDMQFMYCDSSCMNQWNRMERGPQTSSKIPKRGTKTGIAT